MTTRLWLNRTFATNCHVIDLIRDNPDGHRLHVIASHKDAASPVLAAADEAFVEDTEHLTDAEYVTWALDVCRDRGVDLLWPRYRGEALAAAADAFTAAGVTVLSAPAAPMVLFEDKAAAYAAARELGIPVPEHRVVRSAAEFDDACDDLRAAGHKRLCIKPVQGVGGEGFFPISPVEEVASAADLYGTPSRGLPEAHIYNLLLGAEDPVAPIMVMPLLTGGEFSVDTLADPDGRLVTAVPRFKTPGSRRIELLDRPDLVEFTRRIVEGHRLGYLSNTQFRLDEHGEPWLLEVNTRASGGLFQSCLAGVNLPWLAVKAALTGRLDPAEVPAPRLPVALTTVPTAVRLR